MEPKREPKDPKRLPQVIKKVDFGTKTDQKRGQGTLKDPKDVTKVVSKVKSSHKSSKWEAKRPTFTQKTSQKTSRTMKHGGGTGVSQWIIYYMMLLKRAQV